MADEMRIALADLIAKAKRNKNNREFSCEQERNFFLAEQLIENGVIVMPCKVGDTVYIIDYRYTKCTAYGDTFDEYHCSGCECSCDSRKEYYIRPAEITNIHWIFNMWDYFGEKWFTDLEEAEAALKTRC